MVLSCEICPRLTKGQTIQKSHNKKGRHINSNAQTRICLQYAFFWSKLTLIFTFILARWQVCVIKEAVRACGMNI